MKSQRVDALVRSLPVDPAGQLSPYYLGYFHCFNKGDYYEAHDVLEHLWLGCSDSNSSFYKGLIQIAGAFVHLKKHDARPYHPKDARRLHPAVRLFVLGVKNIEPFGSYHLGLDIRELSKICQDVSGQIQVSGFTKNPWSFADRPILQLRMP